MMMPPLEPDCTRAGVCGRNRHVTLVIIFIKAQMVTWKTPSFKDRLLKSLFVFMWKIP